MKHFEWLQEKPEFTEDCIVITATYWEHFGYMYDTYIVMQDEYWVWLNMNGEEIGDIKDLHGELYMTIPQI